MKNVSIGLFLVSPREELVGRATAARWEVEMGQLSLSRYYRPCLPQQTRIEFVLQVIFTVIVSSKRPTHRRPQAQPKKSLRPVRRLDVKQVLEAGLQSWLLWLVRRLDRIHCQSLEF